MTHKQEIKFNPQEVELIADIHKELVITIVKGLDHIPDDQIKFHLCTFAMAVTIANMMDAFHINKKGGTDLYINDFCDLTKKLHRQMQEKGYTGWIQINDGKITEGPLN